MKHNLKITILLLSMFLVTQFVGLYVVDNYFAEDLPYGMGAPEVEEEVGFYSMLPSLVLAFIIAVSLVFLLSKFKADFILKLWFFAVVLIALGLSINAFLPEAKYASLVALVIALPLALHKIYRQNFYVHNLTELLIYPGIAAVFVPILNFWTIIIVLLLISVYDMWAVWHSQIMQKMAKYQMDNLKIFSGFFVPYASKKTKEKIKKMSEAELKKKKIRVNLAILGGGDVIFPIIAAGVMLKTFGLASALFVILGATLGLLYLFFLAEKKKYYPAMPYITSGIFLGMIAGYLVNLV